MVLKLGNDFLIKNFGSRRGRIGKAVHVDRAFWRYAWDVASRLRFAMTKLAKAKRVWSWARFLANPR